MEKELVENEGLRLIVLESAKELGEKIDKYLLDKYGLDSNKYTFIAPVKEVMFDSGEGKVEIPRSIRDKDVYIIGDIGNYSLTYEMRGITNHMSPNDHMFQIKNVIGAINQQAGKINLVMPLLYNARQHKKNTREPLSCSNNLRELEDSGVKTIITFDAHDANVQAALNRTEFDNVSTSTPILNQLIDDLPADRLLKMLFIAPDSGADRRRNIYLNSFGSAKVDRQAGNFSKVRDYNNLVNGSYPVVGHNYNGSNDIEGRTAIIVDDMISSGGSMIDTINQLKDKNVKYIYVCVSFALFTKGIEKFKKLVEEGKLDGVYTTNLTYIPEEYKKEKWLHVCDCSQLAGKIIYNIHNGKEISNILQDKSEPTTKLNQVLEQVPTVAEESGKQYVKTLNQ